MALDSSVGGRDRIIGTLSGAAAAVIWGGSSVVSRYLVTSSFDPVDLTFLRYAACFPIAIAAFWFWYPRLRLGLDWRRFSALMVLAGPPFHFLVIAGYAFASAGSGAVLLAGLLAVFTILTGVVLRGGRCGVRAALCIGAVAGGVGLLATQAQVVGDGAAVLTPAGIAIFALAALLWAQLNHIIARWGVEPLAMTISLAVWSPVFLPLYLVLADGVQGAPGFFDFALQLIYHGWLVAFGATFLYFVAVRKLGAEAAAVLVALAPVLSVVFGIIILGEPATIVLAVGTALVLIGFVAALGVARPSERR